MGYGYLFLKGPEIGITVIRYVQGQKIEKPIKGGTNMDLWMKIETVFRKTNKITIIYHLAVY